MFLGKVYIPSCIELIEREKWIDANINDKKLFELLFGGIY